MSRPRLLPFALSLTMGGSAAPAADRGLNPDDVYRIQAPNSPRLSPDGKRVVFVLGTIDAQKKRHSAIWSVPVDGSRPATPFTTSRENSSAPSFSPDGQSLAFLSARPSGEGGAGDKTQVYVLPIAGGEARRLTTLPNGVVSFVWSPDSSRIACVAKVDPAPDTDARFERSDSRRYKIIDYKFDGAGWFDGKRTHIFVVEVASGKPHPVTRGDDWDDTDPAWSPDSARLAFASDRTSLGMDNAPRHSAIWLVGADGGEAIKISDHDEASNAPTWSPDGKTIAFFGSLSQGDHPKVWLIPATGGRSTLASPKMDALAAGLEWGEGGKALFFEAGLRGDAHLFRLDIATKEISQITKGNRRVRLCDRSDVAKLMVCRLDSFELSGDIFVASLDGANERVLTHFSADLAQGIRFSKPERISWVAADGVPIEGFLVKPIDFDPAKRYPLVSWFHGGPNGMHGYPWSADFQVLASHGYAVFLPNHRGSSGYGEAFQRAVVNEWGGKAYTDIQSGIDAVLRANPWIDKDRLGIVGHSFGGFMTMWTTSQTTRFKAAVVIAGIDNFVNIEGTRDVAYSHRRDFGGDLFQGFDLYWRYSALQFASRVKTPTLILHGEADLRVPLEQGEQWFRALKHLGVETELVVFPRGNHVFRTSGEPKQVVETLHWQLYWMDRFLKEH